MTQTTDNNLPSISNPDSVLKLATDLQKFVQEKKLTTKIQGQEYVNVEGWQYAGSTLGILPIPESIRDISVEGELKYEAKVKLLNIHTGKIIGRGFAVCSNKEQGKKFYAEYAIASMAQTRAVGKAYRLCLGWLMKAAGFQATPAEEMDFTDVRETLKKGIAKSNTHAELDILLETYPEFKDILPIASVYFDRFKTLQPAPLKTAVEPGKSEPIDEATKKKWAKLFSLCKTTDDVKGVYEKEKIGIPKNLQEQFRHFALGIAAGKPKEETPLTNNNKPIK